MQQHNIKIADLSGKTGVPASTIKRIKVDDSANPTMTSLIPIADFFNITINELVGVDPLPSNTLTKAASNQRGIPLLSWNDVSDWPNEYPDEATKHLLIDIPLNLNSFALMIDREIEVFAKGSIIVINCGDTPKNDDYVIVVNKTVKQATLFQYILHDGAEYLKSMLKGIPLKKLNAKIDKLVGKVIQIRMDL